MPSGTLMPWWLACAKRLSQCPFHGPTVSEALFQRAARYAKPSRPPRYGVRLAVVGQQPVRALVARLLAVCRPAHVAWFVMAVVIDAIKGMPQRWARPHVAQEHREVAPRVADTDAAPAVVGVVAVTGRRAAAANVRPRLVFARARAAWGAAVGALSLGRTLSVQTSTARGVAALETRKHHDGARSAIAVAGPTRPTAERHALTDPKPPEARARDVGEWWHVGNYLMKTPVSIRQEGPCRAAL